MFHCFVTMKVLSKLVIVLCNILKLSIFTTRKRPTNGAPNLAINGALVVRH